LGNHKSAIKRAKQNIQRRLRNKAIKTSVKTSVKKVVSAKNAGDENVLEFLNKAKSVIARAAKKKVIHKNTAARKTSKLAKFVNQTS